jgi:protein-tyrosine phosphatase
LSASALNRGHTIIAIDEPALAVGETDALFTCDSALAHTTLRGLRAFRRRRHLIEHGLACRHRQRYGDEQSSLIMLSRSSFTARASSAKHDHFRSAAGNSMIDLHCHILPGIDDGAGDVSVSLAMAEAFVADGVEAVACTPHILPGLYHNTGPGIRAAVAELQLRVDEAGLPLRLTTGADVHLAPNLVSGLRSGLVLSLADSRYVLIEPPHHVLPARFEESLFDLLIAGFVPIVTHPERLSWIRGHYAIMQRLVERGVWMQITAGSLAGKFGKTALYFSERMLHEGIVHIVASDAHDVMKRRPNLAEGRERAARLVGDEEAFNLVSVRPLGVLENVAPGHLPAPRGMSAEGTRHPNRVDADSQSGVSNGVEGDTGLLGGVRGLGRRLRKLLQ